MVEILNGIDYKILKKFETGPFSGMEYDSRKVKKGIYLWLSRGRLLTDISL